LNYEIENYIPDDSDIFVFAKSGDFQRLIWGEPQELKEREKTAW
jgi:hypothetical protein